MARVVEQLPVVNRILEVQSECRVVANVKGHVVLEGNGFRPHGRTACRRCHHDRNVLEQQVVYALRPLAGVEGEGVGRIDEVDGHAGMGHVADVHAPTVVHGSEGQGECPAHAGVVKRRVLAVVGPTSKALVGDGPNVVVAQRTALNTHGGEEGDGGVGVCSGFSEHHGVL